MMELVWKIFMESGGINYYLLYKSLNDTDEGSNLIETEKSTQNMV